MSSTVQPKDISDLKTPDTWGHCERETLFAKATLVVQPDINHSHNQGVILVII